MGASETQLDRRPRKSISNASPSVLFLVIEVGTVLTLEMQILREGKKPYTETSRAP